MTCSGDTARALNELLDPVPPKLLHLVGVKCLTGRIAKCRVDEYDVFSDAMSFYKHPEFCASSPVRVYYNNQPGIDTGGIRQQFFTDVLQGLILCHYIFVGPLKRLRPDNSPQVLTLIKILGTIIAHSLLQEGPGFPFHAPYVY